MKYIKGDVIIFDNPTVITLGNFDGIHLGHRKLINTVKECALREDLTSVIVSFLPHPRLLFNPDYFSLILTPEEKRNRLNKIGVDYYIDFSFTKEFASMSPEEFASLLFDKLKAKIIVIGENYRFGYKKGGDSSLLKLIGKQYNAKIVTISEILVDNEKVSSTRIRSLLANMNLEKANELLYEPYSIIGTVVKGKQLGRNLGFPTINILADKVKLFPVNGVYATRTIYDGVCYNSITNVGYNPTVNGSIKVIETHVLEFDKFVYGEKVEVEFLKFFRKEIKFKDIESLQAQIKTDIEVALSYFKS